MAKKLISLLLCAVLALGACFAGPAAWAEEGAFPGSAWLCDDVVGSVNADTPVELKDDFGLAVNKDWILTAQIPDGETDTSAFNDIARTVQDRQIALMKDETLTGHDAELVQKLYKLVSDWDYRDAQGVEPAMPYMQAIADITDLASLTAYLYSDKNLQMILPFSISVGADFVNPDIYITQIGAPGLMLQDSAEYKERTQAGDLYYALYEALGTYMLERLGKSEEEAGQILDNAMAFDALLAEHIRPMSDRYQADYYASILNYYEPAELEKLAGGFPIMDMIEASKLSGGSRFLVTEPDYIAALADLYTEENVGLMRDWLAFKTALSVCSSLDQETYKQIDEISNSIMGISGVTSEDDNALSTVSGLLPVPMDNLYIQTYCTEKQQQDILKIIDEVLGEYRRMLEATEWLSGETRDKAIEKLDNIRVHAVYPSELGDWSSVDFAGTESNGSLIEAQKAVNTFLIAKMAAKIDTEVDKDEWDQLEMTSSTINAFYSPQKNSINILAGILNGEFYNEDMSREQMLGAIGSVIGHEISHAFDTQGAQFDKDGAYANWWTDEDYAAFQERAAKLAAWYDNFKPMEGITISGQQIQTEAIADMAGVKCMLAIADDIEGFDYDAFFRQFATIWRQQSIPSSLVLKVASDVHPMRYLRVNATLAQYDDFLDCYGITEGDGMYIAPADRVAVW